MSHLQTNRRQFLKMLVSAMGCGYAGSLLPSLAAGSRSYKIAPWTGDDFTRGHQMREGEIPPAPATSDKPVEVVIVGGGMSGLTSAYYLRDHNFLLLEQYEDLGGQSRGNSYRGIGYSYGAAYMGSDKGLYGELFDELAIKPVAVPTSKNSWYWEGNWFPGIDGKDQDLIYKELHRLIDSCKPIWNKLPQDELLLTDAAADVTALDTSPFASFLQGYDPRFVTLMNSYCKSNCAATPSEISALTGVLLVQDLVVPAYVFEGGNPAIARALVDKLRHSGADRLKTGTFVWNIELKSDGASVVYSDDAGLTHKVDCKHVIVTAPPLVASRIISNLDDATRAQLYTFKFGSYLVANMCMRKKVFDNSYDSWLGSPFTFSDIIIAETPYMLSGQYKPAMGSVLTVYHPYSPISEGRTVLLAGNREELAGSLVDQLSKLIPQFQKNLEEVVLTRWGHAMAVAKPGSYARLQKLQAMDTGPLILAHCSMHGLIPSAEAAIQGARAAANRILSRKSS